ncbi:MAG: intradiol ring-cleavage dioxygenase [Pirellulaceae bacterium]
MLRNSSQVSIEKLRQRRKLMQAGACFGAAAFATPGVFADLIATIPQTEGPFYPDKLPLDTDNDLIVINENLTPAVGEITHLSGKVLDLKGNPIRNAFVEIWQVDNEGVYLHSADNRKRDERDTNFQGYGRFLTDSQGRYYFRTVKPVPYPGRTPHIHFGISTHGKRVLTTQLYVKGEKQNERDGVLRGVRDKKSLDTIIKEFKPIEDSKIGELSVDFDIVLGGTASEDESGKMHGIAPSDRSRRG